MSTRLRFGLVGVGNTLVDFVGYTVLVLTGVPAVVANLISTTAGMLLSFTLNRRWTFRADGGSRLRQGLLFLGVNLAVLWVLQPLVIAGVSALLPEGLPPLLAVAGPKAVAIGVGLVVNYVLYDRLVFPAHTRAGGNVPPATLSG